MKAKMCAPMALLKERARLGSNQVAHVVDSVHLTYGQWLADGLVVCARLEEVGVRQGDRVLMQFDVGRLDAYAVAYVAAQHLGAIVVPVNTSEDDATLRAIIESSGTRWLLQAGDERTAPRIRRAPGEHSRSQNGGFAGVAEVLYTSGTTGAPEGYACFVDEICHYWEPGDGTAEASSIDLHGAAFGTNYCQEMLRTPLLWGSVVVSSRLLDIATMAQLIDREKVTTLRLTPPLAHGLVRNAHRIAGLVAIRDISISSAYSSPELLAGLARSAPNARIVNQYSLTESGRAKLKSVWGEDPSNSVGRPVEGTQVRVVDGHGEPVPACMRGEIQLRHSSARRRVRVIAGTTEVASRRSDTAWVRTGDIGYLDEKGYVYLVDRAADLINVGGRKVSPLHVEQQLMRESRVADVAVVGVPHPTLGEVVGALVVTVPGTQWADDVLETVAEPDRPRLVRVVDTLPRNLAGKVVRQQARAQLLDGGIRADSHRNLTSERAEVVALVDVVLGGSRPSLEQSWYEAGGDSIAALELMAHVDERYGAELPTDLFFGDTTLDEIVDWVLAHAPEQSSQVTG